MEQEILHIISYLKGELSEKEIDAIEQQMLESPEFRKKVNDIRFIYDSYEIIDKEYPFHTNQHWDAVQKIINTPKKGKRVQLIRYISRVAAIALIVVSTGLLYYANTHTELISEIEKIERPDSIPDEIQLILSDAQKMKIEKDNSEISYNKKGNISVNAKEIDIQPDLTTAKEKHEEDKIQYNQLIVPNGKRSHLTLSDGTKIWVNAGSRVVYPVTFEKEKREIYVDGEIFIEVSPDKDCPFYVKTNKLDVKVLGTSFNVSSFNDEEEVSVVLVTGKVNVKTKDNKKAELVPNQLLKYKQGNIQKQEVDVEEYISWKDGYLRFEHEKFATILKKLSRYHRKEIIYTNEAGNLDCSGTLNLQESIEDQLQGICNTVPIEFTIEADKIKIDVKH